MYKMMVVDDEFNIRDGIANFIPWNKIDVEVVCTAVNGIEALEKFDLFKPDIVISDIMMDKMDGLNLVKELKIKNPLVKVIILSGHEEFEYAKKSIELKVSEYLLKPVLSEELLEKVRSIISEIKEENKLQENMGLLKDGFYKELLNGVVIDVSEMLSRMNFLGIQMTDTEESICVVLAIDEYFSLQTRLSARDVYLILLKIKDICQRELQQHFDIALLMGEAGEIISILGGDFKSLESLYFIFNKIKKLIMESFGMTVTVGVGRVCAGMLNVRKSYLEAKKAIEHKLIAGNDTIIHIDDISVVSNMDFMFPFDIETKLLMFVETGNKLEIARKLDEFFSYLYEQNMTYTKIKGTIIQLIFSIYKKLIEMGVDMHNMNLEDEADPYKLIQKYATIDEIKASIDRMIRKSIELFNSKVETNVKHVITIAQEYIRCNYQNPELSLQTISERFYLNPSYFSQLYKKETGESYINYLMKIRLDEAMKILRETNIKVVDVGRKVGYLNAQYFCTMFKKNVGISPAEYREKFGTGAFHG